MTESEKAKEFDNILRRARLHRGHRKQIDGLLLIATPERIKQVRSLREGNRRKRGKTLVNHVGKEEKKPE